MSDRLSDKLRLPENCRSVLCAVSGGADSVCMLYLMCEAAEKHRIRVCAAHYEHGIRGEESLRDANFVEELCKALNVPLLTEHGNVPAWAAENRLGTGGGCAQTAL